MSPLKIKCRIQCTPASKMSDDLPTRCRYWYTSPLRSRLNWSSAGMERFQSILAAAQICIRDKQNREPVHRYVLNVTRFLFTAEVFLHGLSRPKACMQLDAYADLMFLHSPIQSADLPNVCKGRHHCHDSQSVSQGHRCD